MKNEYLIGSGREHQLIIKHPELSNMSVFPLEKTDLKLEELSDFIEMCWMHDYGLEPRIRFSPEFLEWNMGKNLSGMAVRGSTGELLGVYLCFERYYCLKGRTRAYAFETGLSVHPNHRGKGIGQWLAIALKKMMVDKGVDFYLTWYDTRHNLPGSSFQIFTANTSGSDTSAHTGILLRILNFNKALDYLASNAFEVLCLKLKTRFFANPLKKRLPDGYTLEGFREERLSDYHDFMLRYQSVSKSWLIPAAKDFMRWQQERYNAARFYALREKSSDRVLGVYFGHKIPLDDNWFYFQADGILTDPDIDEKVAEAFFKNVEIRLNKDGLCMGVSAIETVCENNLWQYGYLPIISHLLTLTRLNSDEIKIEDLKNGLIELR